MKKISAIIAALALVACSGVTTETLQPALPIFGEDVVKGELLVRFDESVAEIIDRAGLTKSGPSNVMEACAIPSVEEVLAIAGKYRIERVFTVDSRNEELSRKEGLHLWYRVSFSEDAPMDRI